MRAKQHNNTAYFFRLLGFWGLLCLIQAAFIELDPDEAYYWVYTRQLDWGYFDHPPGVALVIALGYSWLPNELGVRLGTILSHLLTIYIFWLWVGKPTQKRHIHYLFAMLLAMPLLQIYGLIATPDGPLLLFTALFFYWYEQFLKRDSWGMTFLLGACMAALLYSKYHGVLLIFFVLLSNLSLLRNPKFYVASIFGAMLFLPHLYWQYANDFPSFRYHLQGRNDTYELKYTITYIVNQLVIFSPLLLPFWLISLRKSWSNQPVIRAIYFVVFGFWAFFFYSSFKGHVEPQWTAMLSLPLVYLLYQRRNDMTSGHSKDWFSKWAYRMALISVILIVGARFLVLMFNPFGVKSNFHRSDWIYELQDQADGKPVVFENSYRNAAKYSFYAKEHATTFSNHLYRKNQYDIWTYETALHGKTVLLVMHDNNDSLFTKKISVDRRTFLLQTLENLQVKEKIAFTYQGQESQISAKAGDRIALPLELYNPYSHDVSTFVGNAPLRLYAAVYQEAEFIDQELPLLPEYENYTIPAGKRIQRKLELQLPNNLEKGTYQLHVGFRLGALSPDEMEFIELVIE